MQSACPAPSGTLERAQTAAAMAFEVAVSSGSSAALTAWDAAMRTAVATPFQSLHVMDCWIRAMAARPDVEPFVVTVREREGGALALALPLIRHRVGRTRVIGFADLGIIDYNGPALGPAAPRTAEGAKALWRAVRRALPAADLVDLRKMPPRIGDRPNPLALLGAMPCALNGNIVRTGDDWEAYRHGLKRVVRKELDRSWRVFTRHPGAAFRTIADPAERRRVLAAIEVQQPLRMQATGKRYVLDEPSARAFYRNLVDAPPGDGSVLLTAVMAGEEVVAALLGLYDGIDYIMIRIASSPAPEWSNASPGRLVIDRTMAWLHGQGCRSFDFSIGDYDYKRRFGVTPLPLVDLVRPLGVRGVPAAASALARDWLRRHPGAEARLRRLVGGRRDTGTPEP